MKYIYGIEPNETINALETGSNYHKLVEDALKSDNPQRLLCNVEINTVEQAMASAFGRLVLPLLPKVKETEKFFEYKTPSGFTVIGYIDAVSTNGEPIEHKTTSSAVTGAYWQNLEFDEQIMTYMTATGKSGIWYTVCRKPTIRIRQNESAKEFANRCAEWYSETGEKIDVAVVTRTDEQLEQFLTEQDAIIQEMHDCKNFYKNPSFCTHWGRMCPYAPICQTCKPTENYIGFSRRFEYHEENESVEDGAGIN